MDVSNIVLGLGNPGLRYRKTRHNLGFWVLDRLAKRYSSRFRKEGDLGRKAWTAEVESGSQRVVFAKPRTYMNRSGGAAAALCRRYRVGTEQLLVVHDEADLPLGRLRIRREGGAGGHNGLRSLIEVLGNGDFARIRLGVAGADRPQGDLADYLLTPFTSDERETAERLADLAADAVQAVLVEGIEAAQNRFHTLNVGSDAEQSERG